RAHRSTSRQRTCRTPGSSYPTASHRARRTQQPDTKSVQHPTRRLFVAGVPAFARPPFASSLSRSVRSWIVSRLSSRFSTCCSAFFGLLSSVIAGVLLPRVSWASVTAVSTSQEEMRHDARLQGPVHARRRAAGALWLSAGAGGLRPPLLANR